VMYNILNFTYISCNRQVECSDGLVVSVLVSVHDDHPVLTSKDTHLAG